MTNSSNLTHISLGFNPSRDFNYKNYIGRDRWCSFNDTSGVAVGSTCTTETSTYPKGVKIYTSSVSGHGQCDQPNATFGWEAEFYVNGNLEETARGTTGVSISEYITFIVP